MTVPNCARCQYAAPIKPRFFGSLLFAMVFLLLACSAFTVGGFAFLVVWILTTSNSGASTTLTILVCFQGVLGILFSAIGGHCFGIVRKSLKPWHFTFSVDLHTGKLHQHGPHDPFVYNPKDGACGSTDTKAEFFTRDKDSAALELCIGPFQRKAIVYHSADEWKLSIHRWQIHLRNDKKGEEVVFDLFPKMVKKIGDKPYYYYPLNEEKLLVILDHLAADPADRDLICTPSSDQKEVAYKIS